MTTQSNIINYVRYSFNDSEVRCGLKRITDKLFNISSLRQYHFQEHEIE